MTFGRVRLIAGVSLVNFLSGICLTTVWIFREARRAVQSADWPSVSGVVVESEYEPGAGRLGGGRKRLLYRYQAGGKEFEGKRVGFGNRGFPHPGQGNRIRVYYDPEEPGECALQAGFRHRDFAPFYWLVTLLVMACIPLSLGTFGKIRPV